MIKGIFSAEEATASTFRNWKARLFLAAGLLLAVGCTIVVPVEEIPTNTPTTDTKTTTPVKVDEYPPQGVTRDPAITPFLIGTPTPFDTPTPAEINTPTPEVAKTPITPDGGTSTVRRIPDTPTPEPGQLLPKNTVALVMAVKGGNNSGALKTIVTEPGTGTYHGIASIALESSSISVVLYLPDSEEATVTDSYSSLRYVPHFKRSYTVDGRLYVSNKFTNGGSMTISEYNTNSLSRISEWGT